MLREVYIENLAVIQKASIPFASNFNVFTGETGAGKSILINGINAILGQRVTKDIVRTGASKAIITALFTDLSQNAIDNLLENGIECEDGELTITREISADGGSVARINGKLTSVSVLKKIGEFLINIHGQHDNQILLIPEKHLDILDGFSGDYSCLDQYKESFKALQNIARKIGELKKIEQNKKERASYLNQIIQDLEELNLDEDDLKIEDEYNKLKNADLISKSLQTSQFILNGEEQTSIIDMLVDVEANLNMVEEFIPDIKPILERINSARVELDDISEEISKKSSEVEIDGQMFDYITNRINILNRLRRVYNTDINGLMKLYSDAVLEIENMNTSIDELKSLNEQKEKLLLEVTEKAKELSNFRKETASNFSKRVTEELLFLDMPNVIIEVKHEKGKLTINGMDNVEFLISANKGETPKSIAKIASGGELSRIMLALKNVVTDKDDIPTLIFDEIDTGVSGRAAQKIGIKLKEISSIRQVLCVTHLAQIAIMGDNHLLIEKRTIEDRTSTNVYQLNFEERKKEIARIMGGENVSELMLKNAEEQLIQAQNLSFNRQ